MTPICEIITSEICTNVCLNTHVHEGGGENTLLATTEILAHSNHHMFHNHTHFSHTGNVMVLLVLN